MPMRLPTGFSTQTMCLPMMSFAMRQYGPRSARLHVYPLHGARVGRFSNETPKRRKIVQLWTTGVASARGAQRAAQEIEAAGWDGMLVVDSQNLSGDPYVSLALAGAATTRIGLGTGVTNSVTRHAAAAATASTSANA